MKTLALFLLATIAAASADKEPWCRCAAFVTYQNAEMMVYEAPEVPITSCDESQECMTSCANELSTMTNGGDLWSIGENGLTIGQDICTYLADRFIFFVNGRKVYGYYEVCGGAWQYAGIGSQQELCCNGGKHEHCISV